MIDDDELRRLDSLSIWREGRTFHLAMAACGDDHPEFNTCSIEGDRTGCCVVNCVDDDEHDRHGSDICEILNATPKLIADLRAERERWRKLREWLEERSGSAWGFDERLASRIVRERMDELEAGK